MNAMLLSLPEPATDGVLAIVPLGLKLLHFDFERNIMSWEK